MLYREISKIFREISNIFREMSIELACRFFPSAVYTLLKKISIPSESATASVSSVGGTLDRNSLGTRHIGRLVALLSDDNVEFNNLQ